jgi:hypothetical protein
VQGKEPKLKYRVKRETAKCNPYLIVWRPNVGFLVVAKIKFYNLVIDDCVGLECVFKSEVTELKSELGMSG